MVSSNMRVVPPRMFSRFLSKRERQTPADNHGSHVITTVTIKKVNRKSTKLVNEKPYLKSSGLDSFL